MPRPRPLRLATRLGPVVVATVLLALGGPALAQGASTAASLGLLGDVATVREFHRYADDDEARLRSETRFGPSGQVVEHVAYSYAFSDGSLRSRFVTSHDDAGLRLVQVAFDGAGVPTGQTVFRYDAQGRSLGSVSYDAAGQEAQSVAIELDAAGNAVAELHIADGAQTRRSERRFDAAGEPLEVRQFDADGRLTFVATYTVPGRTYAYLAYDDAGEVDERGTVEHDAEGRILRTVEVDEDGIVVTEVVWTYDDAGRLVEWRYVDADGDADVTTSNYTLDEAGNWVRVEVFEVYGGTSELYEVREREIDYR